MALRTVCGAECGMNALGTVITYPQLHWEIVNTVGIETTVIRSGAKSYAFVAAAGNPALYRSVSGSPTIAYALFYFRLTSVAPSSTLTLYFAGANAGANPYITVDTGGVLGYNVGSGAVAGPTLVANTWYGIEVESDISANPRTGRWRVWDATNGWVTQTAPATFAVAASTFYNQQLELNGVSSGVTMYLDDIVLGDGTVAGEDYDSTQSKGGRVLRYRPNADGTHSFTAGDMGYNSAGADVATSATDVYTYLDDDDQTSLADFIRQKVIRTTGYVEVAFEDEATQLYPRAVGVTSTYHSSSTGANTMSLKLSDDGFVSSTAILTDNDISEFGLQQRGGVMVTPPSGGPWTVAKVNALTARWGYSSDVTDIPYIDTVSLEVAWLETVPAFIGGGFFP